MKCLFKLRNLKDERERASIRQPFQIICYKGKQGDEVVASSGSGLSKCFCFVLIGEVTAYCFWWQWCNRKQKVDDVGERGKSLE